MTDTMLSHDGITQPITEWALDYGIYPAVIVERLERGWSTDRALTMPMAVAPRQRLNAKHLPGLPELPRHSPKPLLPRAQRGALYHHDGADLTLLQWSEQSSIRSDTLRSRIRRGLTMTEAIAIGRRPACRPGVVQNLPASIGTGGGPLTQDIIEIEISQ